MKIRAISKVASFVISSVMIQTAVAGHAVGIGVGPHFGGGGFRGGRFHSAPAFGGGARFSCGGHPRSGQPAMVCSPSRSRTSLARLTITSHQRDPVSSIDRQSKANSRFQIASRTQERTERAGNHIFSRRGVSVRRYNNKGVYFGNRFPDPTVTAVQQDLTKLGYYRGSIDGLYGRATRNAVARYQTDHHLAVTSTLTSRMLQLLGISPTGRGGIGSVAGFESLKES